MFTMAPTTPLGPHEAPSDLETVIPVLEETLHVTKRQFTSGVARVHISVSEHDEDVQSTVVRQDLAIDRVPVGTFITETPPVRRDGDTVIVSIVEERVVVEKRLFLVEELHIRVDETRHTTNQTVRVRREHAEIDQQHLNPHGD